jgi:LmbE family N-acetylglucosaminyl deacetylase
MNPQKSICVIMAHADDIEYNAGATLARYIDHGYRGLYGVMSRCNSGYTVVGQTGHFESSVPLIAVRRAEAAAAAKVYGAETYFGDVLERHHTLRDGRRIFLSFRGAPGDPEDAPEGTPFVSLALTKDEPHSPVQELVKVLVEWAPEVVISQRFQDWNPDHYCASLGLYLAWREARKVKPQIGEFWIALRAPDSEGMFPPLVADRFVDVTGYEEKCLQALACHQSQRGDRPYQDKARLGNWRHWGKIHGCASAEAFVNVEA